MKSAFFTLCTLAAGAFASPVAVVPATTRDVVTTRAAVEVEVTLVKLTETIKTYTGAISKSYLLCGIRQPNPPPSPSTNSKRGTLSMHLDTDQRAFNQM